MRDETSNLLRTLLMTTSSRLSTARTVLTALALLPATLLAQSNSAGTSDRESVSGSDVAIYNPAGRVRVEAGSGQNVTVDVTRGGRDARDLRVVVSEIRGRNTLRVLYPDDQDIIYRGENSRYGNSSSELSIDGDGTWGGRDGSGWRGRRMRIRSSGRGTEAWADLVIRVPAGKTIGVYVAVGELTSTRVDGDVRLDVASAGVSAVGHRGTLTIDAGAGGVAVRDARVTRLSIDVGSGGVDLENVQAESCVVDTGSGGVRGNDAQCGTLRVDVGSGSVRLSGIASSNTTVDAGSGGVSLDFTSSLRSLTVDAGSGTVSVGLPANFGADVDIETGSGGITTDFPVRTTRLERNHLRGTIGDGAGRVRIEAGSGGVQLRKSESRFQR